MFKFNLERFMSFKVNTYAVRNRAGGCIKCAALYAMGYEYPISDYWCNEAYTGPHWSTLAREIGEGLVSLINDAEDALLCEIKTANPDLSDFDIMGENVCPPEAEARIKKFVIEGMVELGLIETAKEIEHVKAKI